MFYNLDAQHIAKEQRQSAGQTHNVAKEERQTINPLAYGMATMGAFGRSMTVRCKKNRAIHQTTASFRNDMALYQIPDGTVKLDVRLEKETISLTQKQIAAIFESVRSVITKHLRNIFTSGELNKKAMCKNAHSRFG